MGLKRQQKVGAKRQITLTKEECEAAGIQAGDEVKTWVDGDGRICIAKKESLLDALYYPPAAKENFEPEKLG